VRRETGRIDWLKIQHIHDPWVTLEVQHDACLKINF
jgi:hypothetical protein